MEIHNKYYKMKSFLMIFNIEHDLTWFNLVFLK